MSSAFASLDQALAEAMLRDAARDRAAAMDALDGALGATSAISPRPHPSVLFKALLLRAELATDSGDLIGARGWLAEARQVRLGPGEREGLSAEARRADDLESFLTHRGCAG